MAPHRILIVDNEQDVLEGWERALRLEGYTVSTAQTAKEALALCDEHLFDLVILDFLMPTMDGVELLGRIRKKIPLVRSIIISGRIDEENTESSIREILRESVETDIYLHKALTNKRLKSCIKDLLEQPSTSKSWKEMAKQAGQARKVTVRNTRQTSKVLRKLVKKPRKKK